MPSKIISEIEVNGMESEMDISAGSTTPKKVKERKKIKKHKTVFEEEPDCEPPAPKKKKKEKLGKLNNSTDLNGNVKSPVNGDTSYSNEESIGEGKASEKKKKKKKATLPEVVNEVFAKTSKLISKTNGYSTATTPAQSSEDTSSDNEKEPEALEQTQGAFSNFRISPNTVTLLKARGISYLFDIQTQTFNSVYDGKDVIGQARTGTGKTLAFAIPLIEKIQNDSEDRKRGRPPRVMCLTPTRELAIQVAKDFKDMTRKLSVTCIYGGCAYNPQLDAIRSGIDILVGTPGRIKDLLQSNRLNLSKLKHVVLDEVDQMLDMGFAEHVEEIFSASYQKGSADNPQTLLFSATCPQWVYEVAKKYMRPDFEHVDLIGKTSLKTATTVEHLAIACHWSQRAAVIGDVVQVYSGSHGRTIIFCETKKNANELSMNASIKQSCQSLHGDIPQKQREITLQGFRNGLFEVLVATNVAARGLDIPEVDLVIQCSPPKDVESYIHRSGRTGRAGKTGVCICFYQRNEEGQLRWVEQKAGITFKRVGVPTSNDIVKSSSKDALKSLDSVPAQAIEYFRESASKLIEERGAVDALAAALAHISGATTLEQRSLLNSDSGYTTMTLKCSQEIQSMGGAWRALKDQLGEELDSVIYRMCFLKGKMGVCFDVPVDKVKQYQDTWQDGRRWQLSVATELPEMEQKNLTGGDRGFGRSFGGRGGGGRGGGGFRASSGGNWSGGGGSHRRFNSAYN